MKFAELKKLNKAKLIEKMGEAKRDRLLLRLNPNVDVSQFKKKRKIIARIKTIMNSLGGANA